MIYPSFSNWSIFNVAKTFGLKTAHRDDEPMIQWLDVSEAELHFEPDVEQSLAYLRKVAEDKIVFWNEETLKMRFIGPLLELIRYDRNGVQPFYECPLSFEFQNVTISGKIECAIAMGDLEPEQPFVCVHEYKKEVDSSGDAPGQLLIALLAVQALNPDRKVFHGSYIVGQNWYFMVLNEKSFAISGSYSATDPLDLRKILAILRRTKDFFKMPA